MTERTERNGRTLRNGCTEWWEVLKGLKGLKSEGGVCNEWVTNKGWARFLYIVYILWAHIVCP